MSGNVSTGTSATSGGVAVDSIPFAGTASGLLNTSDGIYKSDHALQIITNGNQTVFHSDILFIVGPGSGTGITESSANAKLRIIFTITNPVTYNVSGMLQQTGGLSPALSGALSFGFIERLAVGPRTTIYDAGHNLASPFSHPLTTAGQGGAIGSPSGTLAPGTYQVGAVYRMGNNTTDTVQGIGNLRLEVNEMPTSPIPEPSAFDFNADGNVDVTDADMLIGELVARTNDEKFDLNGNGVVDPSDLTQWLSRAAEHNGFSGAYLPGDANLDGAVSPLDLNSLALNWRQDVAEQLMKTQGSKGEWRNSSHHWLENDPALCTAYSLIALRLTTTK